MDLPLLVAAAVHFDDPRFVKPLIDSLENADGLLATDIDNDGNVSWAFNTACISLTALAPCDLARSA